MKRRLLIPIDLSPYGTMLLRTASLWADRLDAELMLIHRVAGLAPALTDQSVRMEMMEMERRDAEQQLIGLMESAKVADHIKVRLHVSGRDVVHTLRELHGNDGFSDLVMVGIKGTGFVKKVLFGSTATRIVEELNHPVIALPLRKEFFPKGIMVGVHHATPISSAGLTEVLQWLGDSVTVSEVFSVVSGDDSEECTAYVAQVAERFGAKSMLVEGDDAFGLISALMQCHPESLLALQRGGRALTDRVFRDFLTNDLVHQGLTPLLVIP
jgi:nucleotide-binding universal stress UspA family protein